MRSIFITVDDKYRMNDVRAFTIVGWNVVSINFGDKWYAFKTQLQLGSASLSSPFESKNRDVGTANRLEEAGPCGKPKENRTAHPPASPRQTQHLPRVPDAASG